MKHLILSAFLIFGLVACQGEHDQAIDLTEGYDALGEAITPVDAVPVQTVALEGESLIGQEVKLEGVISEVCQGMGCWLTLQAPDVPLIRIDVPRDENGNYVYTFPKDAAGRRAVVAGILTGDIPHHEEGEEEGDHHMEGGMDHDGGDHHAEGDMDHHAGEAMASDGDDGVGHDDRETEVMNATTYTLTASGALLQRVRT